MNKKLLLGIISVLVLAVFIFLIIRKINIPVRIKGGKITSAAALSAKALDISKTGDLLGAKAIYQLLISDFPNSNDIINWQKNVEDINIKLLFSSAITPKSILYEIKPGDTLAKIAKEFKTTPELIAKSNGLKDDKIFLGKKIKVWTAPFSILVDKSQNTLILKTDEEIIKTYIVSTGLNNSTPVGTFKIINKLPNPTWFKAGAVVSPDSPNNVLGSRWMGFDLPGYGIHGTIEPQNLGKQVTQGCVRMANSDVEELYTIVPVGTEVTIVD
ncbi:MAG: L,D-transpeptidase family protein [Candidatus Omnitrophica bacterium]|nr:L,D-transpeptidase family protein [Candidatus Omnitrophota bacterium]